MMIIYCRTLKPESLPAGGVGGASDASFSDNPPGGYGALDGQHEAAYDYGDALDLDATIVAACCSFAAWRFAVASFAPAARRGGRVGSAEARSAEERFLSQAPVSYIILDHVMICHQSICFTVQWNHLYGIA